MARRRRRQSNPSGGSGMTLLLLAGAGYLAYEYLIKPQSAVAATNTTAVDPSVAQAQALASQISAMIAANPNDPSIVGYIAQLSTLNPSAGIQMQGAMVAARQASPSGQAALAQSDAAELAMNIQRYQAQYPDWTADQVAQAAQQLLVTQQSNNNARRDAQYAAAAAAAANAASTGTSGLNGLNPMYSGAWG